MGLKKYNLLFVDDEPNILDAFELNLGRAYNVHTAISGRDGIKLINDEDEYAVIISDMRMPQMDGATFLKEVRDLSPNSVRVLLTGQSDMGSAISAVNNGQISRLLSKPCGVVKLKEVLDECIHNYQTRLLEKEIMENTFKEMIKTLMEILSLANPRAHIFAMEIKDCVKFMSESLKLPNLWEYEVAAMLSQVSCVALPLNLSERLFSGHILSDTDKTILSEQASIANNLICDIPRLECISQMIKDQNIAYHDFDMEFATREFKLSALGSQMLFIARELQILILQSYNIELALDEMENTKLYNPNLLKILKDYRRENNDNNPIQKLGLHDLRVGMFFAENLYSKKDILLVLKGQELTKALYNRIRLISEQGDGVTFPIKMFLEKVCEE